MMFGSGKMLVGIGGLNDINGNHSDTFVSQQHIFKIKLK